jgi:hypothetical protein
MPAMWAGPYLQCLRAMKPKSVSVVPMRCGRIGRCQLQFDNLGVFPYIL